MAKTVCPCIVSARLDLAGGLQLHRPHAVILRAVDVQTQRGQPARRAGSACFQQPLGTVLLRAPAGEEDMPSSVLAPDVFRVLCARAALSQSRAFSAKARQQEVPLLVRSSFMPICLALGHVLIVVLRMYEEPSSIRDSALASNLVRLRLSRRRSLFPGPVVCANSLEDGGRPASTLG